MRRLVRGIAVVLVLLMLVSVVGCASRQQSEQPAPPEKPKVRAGTMYAIMNPPRAGGWDRADWEGVEYLRSLGWEVTVAEGVPYPQTAATAAGYAEKGYDIVIFPDNGQIEAFKEVPPKYPQTWFVMTSLCDELPNAPRVAAWFPDFYVYGNVVGAVAAKASKTGTIGVIGGVPIPALSTAFSGIIEGAKYVNPNANVLVYWVGNWDDVPKHREVTALQTQQGADVIFTVSGPGTTGVFEGAEAAGAKVIGYAADWYEDAPKAVLTSVLIEKRKMYQDLAEQFMAGKLEKKMVNCGADFFKVADFRGSLPEDRVKEIEELVGKMQRGEIVIPFKMHEEIMKK